MNMRRALCEMMLARGSCFVHLDPTVAGVEVPEFCRGSSPLVLQWGLNLPVPIRDLVVDDEGIRGGLSFQRETHWCSVPWSAVLALSDDSGMGVRYAAGRGYVGHVGGLEETSIDERVTVTENHVERPKLRLIKGGKS